MVKYRSNNQHTMQSEVSDNLPLLQNIKHRTIINRMFVFLFLLLLVTLSSWRNGIEIVAFFLTLLSPAVIIFNNYTFRPFLTNKIFLLVLAFLITASLSLVINGLSFLRVDSLVYWLQMLLVGYTAALLLGDRSLLHALSAGPIALVLIFLLVMVAGAAGLVEGSFYYHDRLSLLNRHPNRLGLLCGLYMIFCTALTIYSDKKWIRLASCAGFVILLFILFKTGSRAPLLGLAAALPFMLACALRHRPKLLMTIICLIVLAVSVTAASVAHTSQFERLRQAIANPFQDNTFKSRLAIWHIAWETFLEHPIVGAGYESFEAIYTHNIEENFPALKETFSIVDERIGHAHNLLLHFLAETGLIGAGIILSLWLYIIIAGIRHGPPGLLISSCFLLLLVSWQFDMGLGGRDHRTIVLLLAGLLTGLQASKAQDQQIELPCLAKTI